MEDLLDLWDAILCEFDADTIRELAESADIEVDMIGENISEEYASEIFAKLIELVSSELAEISVEKARNILAQTELSEETIGDLLDC